MSSPEQNPPKQLQDVPRHIICGRTGQKVPLPGLDPDQSVLFAQSQKFSCTQQTDATIRINAIREKLCAACNACGMVTFPEEPKD